MNPDSNSAFAHKELTDRIIKAFYAVYNSLGYRFLESVYEKALLVELQAAGLSVGEQVPIIVSYRGQVVGEFRADLVVNSTILLELKAAKDIDPVFEAQLLNYLKATDIEVGLLLNFGPRPSVKRYVFDNP